MNGNLPPGVTSSMIPGNRPEDEEWEDVFDSIEFDATFYEMQAQEVRNVWILGLNIWLAEKDKK